MGPFLLRLVLQDSVFVLILELNVNYVVWTGKLVKLGASQVKGSNAGFTPGLESQEHLENFEIWNNFHLDKLITFWWSKVKDTDLTKHILDF